MNLYSINTRSLIVSVLFSLLAFYSPDLFAQKTKKPKGSETKSDSVKVVKTGFDTVDLSGLKFRSLGPAITSGRIADFAVDPKNHKRYFVAAASGGVWRTLN